MLPSISDSYSKLTTRENYMHVFPGNIATCRNTLQARTVSEKQIMSDFYFPFDIRWIFVGVINDDLISQSRFTKRLRGLKTRER